jgi:chorismate mutase
MIIEEMEVKDTSLEELIRQSLRKQMTDVQLSPAIRELIWRRIMAWVACDNEEDAETEILPVDFCFEGSRLA